MKHEHEKVIERPLHAVAAMYADRARITEWHPSVGDYRHLSGEPGRPGAKAEIVLKQNITIDETVTGHGDPPGSFSHTDEEKRCLATIVNTFEELTPSSTKWKLRAKLDWSFIMRGLAYAMKGKIEKEICEYMKAFKEFAEAEL